jgi:subtilisin
MNKLRFDASVQPSGHGFLDDQTNPIAGRYYGYLIYAGGY